MTSAGQQTPAALYRALLAAPIPAASLPAGFAAPVSAQPVAPSPDSKAHHAVGVVQVFLTGGTSHGVPYDAGAYYDVFPGRADALADYRAEPATGAGGAPASLPGPARTENASLPNGGTRYAGVEYVDRNVRVFAYVSSRGEGPLPRDARARALALGLFTLKHLEHVLAEG
jgi:hypothetical protein